MVCSRPVKDLTTSPGEVRDLRAPERDAGTRGAIAIPIARRAMAALASTHGSKGLNDDAHAIAAGTHIAAARLVHGHTDRRGVTHAAATASRTLAGRVIGLRAACAAIGA